MRDSLAEGVRTAFQEFLVTPTKSRQEGLVAAADAYREAWIEAKSGRQEVPPRKRVAAKASSTVYERDMYVLRTLNEADIRLALQERTDEKAGWTWWVLSWRTTVAATGRNRRFYYMQGEYWSIPAGEALDMMLEMEARGAFDDRYLDDRGSGSLSVTVSIELEAKRREQCLREITGTGEDWGDEPYFIIVDDPNDQWRKVMLVNKQTGMATFRSLTTSASYRPKKELRRSQKWWLDNTMMDCNVQQMRHFVRALCQVLGHRRD